MHSSRTDTQPARPGQRPPIADRVAHRAPVNRRLAVLAIGAVGLAGAMGLHSHATAAKTPELHGQHVLLISVDGLHASDLSRWVADHPGSNLAALAGAGTTYANASTSRPSDSFPGLMALLTGGTPKTTGVYYDDAYSRDLWAAGSNCTGAPGAEAQYAENIDIAVDGKFPLYATVDPATLPMGMVNGACVPVYPHLYLQTNTIFNVAHDAGLYTAWSDKHPAYEIVNGPTGDGVNDLFTPEINNGDNPTGTSVAATAAYDQIKVQAILNQIDGKTATGSAVAPVPAIFGMNFQAVSVGQKLVNPSLSCAVNTDGGCDAAYVAGGYLPGGQQFSPQMTEAMTFVDGAIGSMAQELHARGLMASTEIIISAKHGQSPIDPGKLNKVGDAVGSVLKDAGIGVAQLTADDIALVWLKDQGQTAAAVAALQADKAGVNTAKIDYVLSGDTLAAIYGSPTANARTPDLIVQPQAGTIYTKSKAKVAEHGGFSPDDTNVAMLIVNDGTTGHTNSTSVTTTQVAPTILDFLLLNPADLKSIRLEGTQVLPK